MMCLMFSSMARCSRAASPSIAHLECKWGVVAAATVRAPALRGSLANADPPSLRVSVDLGVEAAAVVLGVEITPEAPSWNTRRATNRRRRNKLPNDPLPITRVAYRPEKTATTSAGHQSCNPPNKFGVDDGVARTRTPMNRGVTGVMCATEPGKRCRSAHGRR